MATLEKEILLNEFSPHGVVRSEHATGSVGGHPVDNHSVAHWFQMAKIRQKIIDLLWFLKKFPGKFQQIHISLVAIIKMISQFYDFLVRVLLQAEIMKGYSCNKITMT